MAYIGKIPGGTALTSRTLDSMTGDGSDTTLTLSQTPDSVMDVAIFCDGVMQRPGIEYTLTGNTITFTTAPANGVFICALTGGSEDIASPAANSVTTDKLVDGVVTDSKVVSVASSKLSGALPALDGSALTGLPSPFTTNSNDPAIDTNPSGGTGTIWVNSTSGETYVCTDATADANVWTNVGPGSGHVGIFSVQGSVEGYSAGGYSTGISPANYISDIEKYSYTSDSNGTAAPFSLAQTRGQCSSFFSITDGYVGTGKKLDSGTMLNDIEKYTFASSSAGSSVGTLTMTRQESTGCTSGTAGYTMSGFEPSGQTHPTQIDKFVYASEGTTATDSGDLSVGRSYARATMSETHGYCTAGQTGTYPSINHRNEIDRFSFATDGNMVDHGDLVEGHYNGFAVASVTHGYTCGGFHQPNWRTKIQKFAFASASNATDIGDLTQGRTKHAGTQSTTHGYMHGGRGPDGVSWDSNQIEKWSFSTDGNSSDIADLNYPTRFGTGTNK